MKNLLILTISALLLAGCNRDVITEAKRGDLDNVKPIAETRADHAIQQAQASIAKMPKSTKGYGALGQALMQRARETGRLDDYAAALTAFEKAVALDSKDAIALHNLAWCWTMFHRFDKAREFADRAIQVSPTDAIAYGVKFDSEMELGHYDAAGLAAQKMLDLKPCLASYSRAAQYRWVLGDGKGAIMLMKRATDAGAPYAENRLWCMTQLGDYAFKTGNTMAAEQNYKGALEQDKSYKHAQFGLGRVRIAQGRTKEGLALMSEATAKSCPMAYRLEYATLLRAEGRVKEAEEQMAQIVAGIEEHGRYGIAGDEVIQAELLLLKGEEKPRALAMMEKESREHVNWQTLSCSAWAQAMNGDAMKAKATVMKALACGVQEPILWARAARIFELAGEKESAAHQMAAAKNLCPYLAALVEKT